MTESEASRRQIVRQLAGAGKSNRGAGGYSRWVNRPLGRQFAALAFLGGLTPNQVTLVSGLFTICGIVVLAASAPTAVVAVIVTIVLLIGYGLDSADGQLARLRGGGSLAGEWLDHVLDALKTSGFHIAVAVLWFRHYHLHHDAVLLIPLVFAAADATLFFATILSDMLRRIARAAAGKTAETTARVNPHEPAPVLRSILALPNDYGILCLTLLLVPFHDAFIIVYTVFAAAVVVRLLIACPRWFNEMSTLS